MSTPAAPIITVDLPFRPPGMDSTLDPFTAQVAAGGLAGTLRGALAGLKERWGVEIKVDFEPSLFEILTALWAPPDPGETSAVVEIRRNGAPYLTLAVTYPAMGEGPDLAALLMGGGADVDG